MLSSKNKIIFNASKLLKHLYVTNDRLTFQKYEYIVNMMFYIVQGFTYI